MNSYSTETWDAVVIGTGVAGLTLALSLAPRKTLVLTKVPQLAGGSSHWAQGGIAFPAGPQDVESHLKDTILSGAGTGDTHAIEALIGHALEARDWLETQGVVFDRTADGTYQLGREGAHSQRRIYHSHGDATGHEMLKSLLQTASKSKHITLRDGEFVLDLIQENSQIKGLWTINDSNKLVLLLTNQVFLAGGGLGQLFGKTTNPPESTGDAMAMALRLGLKLKDMEMIQFHPTGLDLSGKGGHWSQYPLISEAVRGEGATVVNQDLKPLEIPHPLGCLGPRDIVARSIFQALQKGEKVYVDGRKSPGPEFPEHFPTVFRLCQDQGLDPRKDLLPVTPVVHYTMGGIPVDLEGRTGLHGLWALGECACTGVHGANRLASNSLLECVVYSRLAAPSALSESTGAPADRTFPLPDLTIPDGDELTYLYRLQDILFEAAGPVRRGSTLEKGLVQLKALGEEVDRLPRIHSQDYKDLRPWKEWMNLFQLGHEVINAALENRVSAGAHFRLD